MKALKWILATLVGLLLVVAIYLALFLDLNAYKPQLAERVKAATGRDLVIEGDIGWSLYPNLGLELKGLSLGNLPGESLPPLLTIEDASVGVGLFALVRSELQVEQLAISGATLDWITLEDGRTSLTGLGQADGDKESAPAEQSPSPEKQAQRWQLGHLAVKDLTFRHDNRQLGTRQHLNIDELTLDRIEPGRAAPFAVAMSLGDGNQTVVTKARAMLSVSQDFSRVQLDDWHQNLALRGQTRLDLDLATNIDLDLAAQRFAFSNLALEMGDFELSGQGSADLTGKRPSIVLHAQGNRLDLRPFMSAQADDPDAKPDEAAQDDTAGTQGEPDLTALQAVDLNLDVALETLVLPQTALDDLGLTVQLLDGVLSLDKIKARAFEGQLTGTARLESRTTPAQYQFENQIADLQIQPLLAALADSTVLAGQGNLILSGQGTGLQSDKLVQNLTLEGELHLADGALYGVNVAQLVRDNWAKVKGEFEQPSEQQKTDFASLDSTFSLKQGVFATPDLSASSPLMRIEGNGELDLNTQAVDYALTVALVGSLKGQGGAGIEELNDVPIPLTISGSLTDPKYGVDLDDLFKGKLEQEKDRLEDKLKKKLFEKLGG